MFGRQKCLQFCQCRHPILQAQFLRTKSGARRALDRRVDDGGEPIRSRIQKPEGQVYLDKSRGQHLLTNPRILDTIVRKSHIRPSDTVLEIGPGTGNLTLKLLEAAKAVVAVEVDKRMVEVLGKRVAEHGFQDRLNVICEDALKTEFPTSDLVVANIPYNIASPLLAKLIFRDNPYRSITLLLQKEFARRLLAKPGDSEFNRLAVNVKLVAEAEFIMHVSKREFVPLPKVDSSVVIIRPRPDIPNVDLHEWWAFTRTCFCKKNKTLGATFRQKKKVLELLRTSNAMGWNEESVLNSNADNFDNDKDDSDDNDDDQDEGDCLNSMSSMDTKVSSFREKIIGLLKLGGFEDKRPSKLSNEDLLRLLRIFNEAGIHFK